MHKNVIIYIIRNLIYMYNIIDQTFVLTDSIKSKFYNINMR